MINFIEVTSIDKRTHSINTNHIIEISQFNSNSTDIILSNNEKIILDISREDVINLIEKE
jgi:uncharacterized protein YlzI (FlbEa/FlbD family)